MRKNRKGRLHADDEKGLVMSSEVKKMRRLCVLLRNSRFKL
jgi:hypothetical protein